MSRPEWLSEWWGPLHERARSVLSADWKTLADLRRESGLGAQVFEELHLAGVAERRLERLTEQGRVMGSRNLYRLREGVSMSNDRIASGAGQAAPNRLLFFVLPEAVALEVLALLRSIPEDEQSQALLDAQERLVEGLNWKPKPPVTDPDAELPF
ncbi:hypothetical protein [Meiothermus granaticius]|uniref:Uncharacterized protein n=1 Tax=Meiothermus granaticius NBRC 107808 TaxID=1227551 RepID=A0A399FEL5_9DEIN|nr:hypothetical protein [Meiothermus granaticius]RIH93969.1 hypothetical protein Mgrana_00055 [Meiothermus granaticius NBRC 107808]GEM88203.1 hypothetical protein MGR01S_28280 [Meiothermus granaticius NBRC 107808]